MNIIYKNTSVNYIVFGQGNQTILFLHGWGGSIDSFLPIAQTFNAKCILIDFPPFGKSDEPQEPFTLDDYAQITNLILTKHKINQFNIISHSFGTRVAICLITKYNQNINKLIITSGAGIKPKNTAKKTCRKIKYKIIKLFKKNANLGSKDYRNLSPVMKKTFNNIINLDLTNFLYLINAKTLLIYGNRDKETPLYMAKIFNKKIKNSKLIIYKNKGHFAYLQNINQFILDTKIFLKE